MTIEQVAAAVLEACEKEGIEHMLTGAFAFGAYGIPRSTNDVDAVLSLAAGGAIERVLAHLSGSIKFADQLHFDTLTWGRRLVGTSLSQPPFKVELFELFEDPFVQSQFHRRKKVFSGQLDRIVWLPTPEDVVVQKLRWGRNKDLDDARDVLAVQGPETLDMHYIESWCRDHGTVERLRNALEGIPLL